MKIPGRPIILRIEEARRIASRQKKAIAKERDEDRAAQAADEKESLKAFGLAIVRAIEEGKTSCVLSFFIRGEDRQGLAPFMRAAKRVEARGVSRFILGA